MKLLAIDTATEACSAALWIDGEVTERFDIAPRQHASLILPMARQLLAEAELTVPQLDLLAFGRGPGSFTGVRIAVSVIQGIAFAADLPVLPVSTLTALAQGTLRARGAVRVLSAIDARMGELYWSSCVSGPGGVMRPTGEEQLAAPSAILLPEGSGWHGAGSGWCSHGEILRQRLAERLQISHLDSYPHALDIATLAAQDFSAGFEPLPAEQVLPVYLRNNVVRR